MTVTNWPLYPCAQSCVRSLWPWFRLVAVADVDHATFQSTHSLTEIAPYFSDVFTWDGAKAYKPSLSILQIPLDYFSGIGLYPGGSCLVSNSLFRDLEPARSVGLPSVWLRHPTSLADGLINDPEFEAAPLCTLSTFDEVTRTLLAIKGVWLQPSIIGHPPPPLSVYPRLSKDH